MYIENTFKCFIKSTTKSVTAQILSENQSYQGYHSDQWVKENHTITVNDNRSDNRSDNLSRAALPSLSLTLLRLISRPPPSLVLPSFSSLFSLSLSSSLVTLTRSTSFHRLPPFSVAFPFRGQLSVVPIASSCRSIQRLSFFAFWSILFCAMGLP